MSDGIIDDLKLTIFLFYRCSIMNMFYSNKTAQRLSKFLTVTHSKKYSLHPDPVQTCTNMFNCVIKTGVS